MTLFLKAHQKVMAEWHDEQAGMWRNDWVGPCGDTSYFIQCELQAKAHELCAAALREQTE